MKIQNSIPDGNSSTGNMIEEQSITPINLMKRAQLKEWAIGMRDTAKPMPVRLINGNLSVEAFISFRAGTEQDGQMINLGTMRLTGINGRYGNCVLKVGNGRKGSPPFLCMDFSPSQFLGLGENWKQAEVEKIVVNGRELEIDHTLAGYVRMMRRLFTAFSGIDIPENNSIINRLNTTCYVEAGDEASAVRMLNYFRAVGASSHTSIEDSRTDYFLKPMGLSYLHPENDSIENHGVKFKCKATIGKNANITYATVDLYIKGYEMEANDKGQLWIRRELKKCLRLGVEVYMRNAILNGMLTFNNGKDVSIQGALESYPEKWETIRERYLGLAKLIKEEGPHETPIHDLEKVVNDLYGPHFFQKCIREWVLTVSNFRMLYGNMYVDIRPILEERILGALRGVKHELAEESVEQWLTGSEIHIEGNRVYQADVYRQWRTTMGFDPRTFSFASYRSLLKAQNKACTSHKWMDRFLLGSLTSEDMQQCVNERDTSKRSLVKAIRTSFTSIPNTYTLTYSMDLDDLELNEN